MKIRIVIFITAFLVWCLLSWIPDWQHLIAGVFVALIVSYMIGSFFSGRTPILKPNRCLYFLIVFVPAFLWECLKANIDVAYRVLHPALPIKPGIVKVKTNLKTDIALTFLANSITLTPGTMTVDIDKENSFLYIHWINVRCKDTETATMIIVKKFEKMLAKIFE